MDQISLFGAGIVGVLLTFMVQGAVFGLAVWIWLPENKSPFRDGIGKGIIMCAVFVFCMFLQLIGISVAIPMGEVALVISFVIYALTMGRVFDASFFDALLIGILNIGVWVAICYFLG